MSFLMRQGFSTSSSFQLQSTMSTVTYKKNKKDFRYAAEDASFEKFFKKMQETHKVSGKYLYICYGRQDFRLLETQEDWKTAISRMNERKESREYYLTDEKEPPSPPTQVAQVVQQAPPAPVDPNWTDASSILGWIKTFKLNRGKNRLVETFGKDFTLFQRNDTINELWEGIVERYPNYQKSDKGLHPIPVLAGGPGTGKSRFLDEIEKLLNECVDSRVPDFITNTVFINTTYGNGSTATATDKTIGAEGSLSIRILFEYFRPQHQDSGKFTFSDFAVLCGIPTLSTILQTIKMDIMEQRKTLVPESPTFIVLGIDEFNKLHDISNDLSRELIISIGGVMCSSPANIFFIPILSGTIEKPIHSYISGSMHEPQFLSLPLLEDSDSIEIGKAFQIDQGYITANPYFRRCIGDIGGHVRTLEFFYKAFDKERRNKMDIHKVDLIKIIGATTIRVQDKYNLPDYSKYLTVPLAKAILGIPVKKNEIVGSNKSTKGAFDIAIDTTYQDLNSQGILKLVPLCSKDGTYKIRIPYLWVQALVNNSCEPGFTYWKSMLNYAEPLTWQGWEDFNIRFLALRLSLYSILGYKQISLKELFRGASFSGNFLDAKVLLPETVKLGKLRSRYLNKVKEEDSHMYEGEYVVDEEDQLLEETKYDNPKNMSGYNMFENISNDHLDTYMEYLFLEANGAACDGLSFYKLNLNSDSDEDWEKLLFTLQMKSREIYSLIKQGIFNFEYNKVKLARAKKQVPTKHWVFAFFTNAPSEGLTLSDNSIYVGHEEFQNYYGYTYASRAQFAASNEKIFINSAPIEAVEYFFPRNSQKIHENKKHSLDSYDDLGYDEDDTNKLKRKYGDKVCFD